MIWLTLVLALLCGVAGWAFVQVINGIRNGPFSAAHPVRTDIQVAAVCFGVIVALAASVVLIIIAEPRP